MTFAAGIWHLSRAFVLLVLSVLMLGTMMLGWLLLLWLTRVSHG